MSRITESARGEQCQIRIPGICTHDPAQTVWAHANGSASGKGIGMKSIDELGAYACSACHDAYDRRKIVAPHSEVELMFWQGHARSLIILKKKGLI